MPHACENTVLVAQKCSFYLKEKSPSLPKINTNVQLVYGEHDLVAPLENGKMADSLIPDSDLTILPKENHFCLNSSKEKIIEIIKR